MNNESVYELDPDVHTTKDDYFNLIESQGEGIGIVDKNETFLMANPAAEQIFGVAEGGLVSRNLNEFITPDQFKQILEETNNRALFLKSTYEIEIITPANEKKNLLVTASPRVDKNGNQTGTYGIFRDITEMKNIQETLRLGELRYRSLFESAQDAIILVDLRVIIDCNAASLHMFRCEKQDMIGKTPHYFSVLIQPEGQDYKKLAREKLKLAFAGESRPFEWRYRRKDGSEFDSEVLLSPLAVDSKSMMLVFIRDITERKRSEEALRQSEQKFRDLANLLPTCIYESDLNGILVFANQTGMDWFDFKQEDLGKKVHIMQFIAEKDRQRAGENMKEILENNKISVGEYLAQKKSGETFDVFITSRAVVTNGMITGIRGNIIDITSRKRAEEASLKLASIVESSDDAIIGKTLDGIITSWNKGAEIIFGYKSLEIIGKNASILSTSRNDNEESLLLKKIRNGEHIKHYETIRRKKDGSEFEVSLTISPVFDTDGEIVGVASIARDITERRDSEKLRQAKEAAEALLKNEEKFNKAFHNSPVPICITTMHNPHFIEINEAFMDQAGYTMEELSDRTLRELPIFNDPQDMEFVMYNLTTKGYIRNYEVTIQLKDGEKRIFLLSSELFDLGGEPCALTVLLDITERRIAEQSILESKQRFELMIQQTLVGFIECDTNFIIKSWNPSAERIFGYSAAEAIGRHVGNLIVKDENRAERNKLWRDILVSEGGISSTNTNETKGGRTIICEWHDTPLINPNGHVIGIVSLVADITERKEIEETLKKSREQLKLFAQHLQTVREEERVHISRELHDSLGQSLTGLKMFAFNIFNKLNTDLSGKELDKVRIQSKEVLSIIDDIMQQVRKIAKDIRPRILDEFGLIPAMEAHIQEITKQTNIRYDFIKRIHSVEIEPAHLIEVFRIFQETCTNIIRHANATLITVKIDVNKDSYILEVEDNGCGIRETDITKLKSLGLLGMKERSQVFSGELEITGIEGKGTKVVLNFPKKTNKP